MSPKEVSIDTAIGRLFRAAWERLAKSPVMVAVAFFAIGGGSGTTILPAIQKGLNIGSAAKMDSALVILNAVSIKTDSLVGKVAQSEVKIEDMDDRFASHVEEAKEEHADIKRLIRHSFGGRYDYGRVR